MNFKPLDMKVSAGRSIALACALGMWTAAQAADTLTEDDYLGPVPTVLTVSRLAQSVQDTPGAVTLIDRQTIRRSGARDLADLLRLVPGYMVSGYNGAHPIGAYHAPIDEYGTRNLVLVDGRSLYSSTYIGETRRAWSSVRLEDVERIEILRGSNSATYGANALFGVINVITRHAADTAGAELTLSAGEQGVQDAYARWGWSSADAQASYRFSASQRRDDGFHGLYDSRQVDTLSWRGDLRLDARTELTLQAGHTRLAAGDGEAGDVNSPLRELGWNNTFLQAHWRHEVSDQDSMKFQLSWDTDRNDDDFLYTGTKPAGFIGTVVDYGFVEHRLNMEYQYQHVASDTLRWVLGAGYKEDRSRSRPLFGQNDSLDVRDMRVFGSLEWRMWPDWVLNAGVFAGDNSDTGTYAYPRLMLNHALNDNHTLRVGWTTAQRPPSLYENHGNRTYTSPLGQNLTIYKAKGNLTPEKFKSFELGYYGQSREWGLSGDVRVFHEALRDYIELKGSTPINAAAGFNVRGVEYQLKWTPWAGTTLGWQQAFLDFDWRFAVDITRRPPQNSGAFMWFQELPQQWQLTMLLYTRDSMSWRRSSNNTLFPSTRVDMRLARQFRLGDAQAEAAVTLQALNRDQQEFVSFRTSLFKQRAFATLRLEF